MLYCSSSQELWKDVQDLAGASTKAKVMWYKNEIQRTRKGSMKMKDYLNKMKEYADYNWHAVIILSMIFLLKLCGLESEYTLIVVTLSEKEDLTWIEFQTYLLSFESRLDQLNNMENLSINSVIVNLAASSASLVSKTGNNSNNENKGNWRGLDRGDRGKNSNNRPICQICGKIGHAASICYYRFNQNYMGAPPNQVRANSSSSNKNNGHSPYNAFIASLETVSGPNWYLDSGASHHITINPNNLNPIEKYVGKEILTIGNGQEVKISHIGTSFV